MTDAEWRYAHGVGPEPRLQPPPGDPDPRDRYHVIACEDLIVVTDARFGTGLDTWDF